MFDDRPRWLEPEANSQSPAVTSETYFLLSGLRVVGK
jgi:hypothetical protein